MISESGVSSRRARAISSLSRRSNCQRFPSPVSASVTDKNIPRYKQGKGRERWCLSGHTVFGKAGESRGAWLASLRTMRHLKSGIKITIHGEKPSMRELIERFIRRCAEEFRAETGEKDRFKVDVEAIVDGRGELHLVTVELGAGSDPVMVQESNADAFVAIHEAFFVARRWAAERHPARSPMLAAW